MESNNHIEELIIRYLQDEIQEDELRVLDAWIHESDTNKSHFFELKNLFDSRKEAVFLNRYSAERSWERMVGKLETASGIPARSKFLDRSFWFSFLRYAAIIVVAIGVGMGMNQWINNRLHSRGTDYNEIVVEKGGRANTLLLSDGSKVILNASTRFKYPTSFNGDERVVHLEGEAYFEIAKDHSKPFVVKLKNQQITVLGTSFNIQAFNNERFSVTTLLSGSILLESFDAQGRKMSRMKLRPNQQARSDNRTGSIFLSETDASISNAWVGGKYRFKDETLASIAKRLENYYGVNIHLAHDSLRNIRYTGTFSLDQGIQEVLDIINSEEQFTFTKDGKNILISARSK
ncbi:FecR domain-containing protein [uncultured Parabacteroides sp.]|uniref:FecR family protein n=1 Tax=uncultured Parabacteroides sp. TaxID=512312 RepID=UPI002632389C|nr:FecR domain-containing protein [uncultured Parabacteroides sp.]